MTRVKDIARAAAFLIGLGGLVSPGGAMAAGTAEPAPRTVFRNVKVLSMSTQDIVPDRIVAVEGGRIVAIGSPGEVPAREGERVVDGLGGTLIPGLIDLHTHLSFIEDLDLYLAGGVTTVLNLSGSPRQLAWRRELQGGVRRGPRLLTCGPHVRGVRTPEEAARIAGELADAGYDCVKIYDDVAAEAFGPLVTAARARGLRTIAHIPRNLTWQDAMRAKPDAIAHAEEFLYSPVLEGDETHIAAGMKTGSIALIATLTCYDTITRQIASLPPLLEAPEMARLSPLRTRPWGPGENTYQKRFTVDAVPRMRWQLAFQRDLVGILKRAGVTIVTGTDAGGVPFVFPGAALIDEIEKLVAAGLTPYEALRAATVDAAALLGLADRIGILAPGMDADMVLLRANPLLNIENLELRAGVMARGRWYPEEELHVMTDSLAAAARDERRFLAQLEADGLDAALAVAPGLRLSTQGLNELGYEYLRERKDPVAAAKVFALYARLDPGDWNAWDSLSEALEEEGRAPEAVTACEESLRLEPGNDGCRARIEKLAAENEGQR